MRMWRLDVEIFLGMRKWRGGEGRKGLRRKETLTNKSRMLGACTLQPLPCSLSPKSNSLWHKKGAFVLMFAENWGNKLDRDLANQNSLQKLSDPGGSRALDKQDWLFQKHAYITPVWFRAITHRQLGENKPDCDHNCLAGKHGKISRFSLLKWETFLIKCSGATAWQTLFTVSWVSACFWTVGGNWSTWTKWDTMQTSHRLQAKILGLSLMRNCPKSQFYSPASTFI